VTGPDQQNYAFEIKPFDKQRLMQGLDEVGLTMEFDQKIAEFAANYKSRFTWASVPD
jgi:3-isopropylmalate dehydratase small subunit